MKTNDLSKALNMYHFAIAQIDVELDHARSIVGLTVKPAIDEPLSHGLNNSLQAIAAQIADLIKPQKERCDTPTFEQAYDRYMSDPTHAWSYKTRNAHDATSQIAKSVIGNDVPIREITRAQCRDLIDALQRMPKNSKKRHPKLTTQEVVDNKWIGLDENERMSVANINAYLSRVSSFLNWAELEEMIDRNPLKGMRLKDDVRKRDKRKPFSTDQLNAIFQSPLYTGCENDKGGYHKIGIERPKGSRFWIPLLGLFTGMRLNEICQLEAEDISTLNHIPVIKVSVVSKTGDSNKSLKTQASERLIPIHDFILQLGFLDFVATQKRNGESNLFNDLVIDQHGSRFPVRFVSWFCCACQ